MSNFYSLKEEAKNEAYEYIHENIRPLPKKDGDFNEFADGFLNNDVDALRHAYVSGVYTMEYGEKVANILGRLNELVNFGSGVAGEEEENMDLWNNAIGRKYGKRAKSRSRLMDLLIKALEAGELIVDPKDLRTYKGAKIYKRRPKALVIVVEEAASGENLTFCDVISRKVFSKSEFISHIKKGDYPGYSVKTIRGKETPVSKRDKRRSNNLG